MGFWMFCLYHVRTSCPQKSPFPLERRRVKGRTWVLKPNQITINTHAYTTECPTADTVLVWIRIPQIFPWRANLLQSLAPTLIRLTYLWWSWRVRAKLCRNGPDLRIPGLDGYSGICFISTICYSTELKLLLLFFSVGNLIFVLS